VAVQNDEIAIVNGVINYYKPTSITGWVHLDCMALYKYIYIIIYNYVTVYEILEIV